MNRVSFRLEFIFRASPTILYKFITTPSCLVRWFCDEVDIQGETYTFGWSGSEEIATMVDDIEDERVRFVWENSEPGEFLEFKMDISPVTNETILLITGFCDEDDLEEEKELWHNQIEDLRRETGG